MEQVDAIPWVVAKAGHRGTTVQEDAVGGLCPNGNVSRDPPKISTALVHGFGVM